MESSKEPVKTHVLLVLPRVHKNKSRQLSVVLLWMLSRQNSKFVITANVSLVCTKNGKKSFILERWTQRWTLYFDEHVHASAGLAWNAAKDGASGASYYYPGQKKTATTIMHKIKTLFLSRNISVIRRLAQWHDWPRLRASLHTEAQSSLIFRYPMIGTVFWFYA